MQMIRIGYPVNVYQILRFTFTRYYPVNKGIAEMIFELKKFKEDSEFKKEILYIVPSKKLLTYYEVKAQMEQNCLQDDLCYCDNVLGKFFRKDFLENNK